MRFPLVTAVVSALVLASVAAPAAPAAHAAQAPISDLLSQLVTATPVSSGYDRALFDHWVDADGDGCDTREEVLIAESQTPVTPGASCSVTTGQWFSYYDGATWTNASDVDIDHMVPLSEAWKSGADAWSADQRRAFANDLDLAVSLEAVTDNVNQSKSDRDPAAWLPPVASTHCQYATNWVLVKWRWNLAIDTAERSKLSQLLEGTCGTTAVTLPAKGGTAAPTNGPGVKRLAGTDRYATAVAISKEYATGVPVVYVATGANYPDALSAAPAAALLGGPLLLTMTATLPSIVKAELLRLKPARIVVVGGTGAVSNAVFNQLNAIAPARRDSGADRYSTSRIVNERAFAAGVTTTAFIATGRNFPDALSASAAAGSIGAPVVLVDGNATAVDSATRALLTKLGVTSAKIAGGTGVVTARMEASLGASIGSVLRLAGSDRYSTSSAIVRGSFTSAPTAYFAVGTGFADALAGAALAGRDRAPLMVAQSKCVPSFVVSDVASLGTTSRVLLGGTGVLGSGVENLTVCATAPAPKPPTTPPSNPGNSVNCGDFSTWRAAQDWHDRYFAAYGDVADLDGDGDGVACESLPGAP